MINFINELYLAQLVPISKKDDHCVFQRNHNLYNFIKGCAFLSSINQLKNLNLKDGEMKNLILVFNKISFT